jgi:hypothetical protein
MIVLLYTDLLKKNKKSLKFNTCWIRNEKYRFTHTYSGKMQ